MNDFTHLTMAITYYRAHLTTARRDQRGASAPEYLLLLIGILAIAGLAVLAVRTYVTNKGNELNGGN